ncbi:hypothetical protein [Burkholderia cepacia]|uniref:hypothetical protein n=1 Tax=Burkholderia cepacia TaxID=292 RepID=UPI000B1BF4D4|nr:hypothetical protein [Burkholderia cepacia]
MHKTQVNELIHNSSIFAQNNGENLILEIEKSAILLIKWTSFLISYRKTTIADELLNGVMCAIREGAACLSLGLVRPTLFSMRAQIDLMLTWIYFKDHPVEWRHVNNTGDGFKLKTELFKYFNEMHPSFGTRFGILKDIRTRKEEDPYRLLSAHIHSQSMAVVPNFAHLKDVVSSPALALDCIQIQFDVSEYICDILTGLYLEDHLKVDDEIKNSIVNRIKSEKQRQTLFAGL